MIKVLHYSTFAMSISMACLSSNTYAETAPLVFYTWEDYIDPSIITDWQNETGIPIKLVYYDDEAQRNLVLSREESAKIDLAVVDNATIHILSGAGHLSTIPTYNETTYWPDACGKYGRQYFWGTYGIVYREDKVNSPVTSWRDLLNPEPYLKGHIGMLGQSDELLTAALSGMGYPINTTENTHLEQAFSLLKVQSHYVTTYDYVYTYVLSNPDQSNVWIAPAYSGDQYGLNDIQGIDSWRYVVPEEGAIVWVDCLTVTQESDRKEEALAFIDYLSRVDNSARNSEFLWTASPYVKVQELVSDELRADSNVYFEDEKLAKATPFHGLSGREILKRTRIKDALLRYYDSN
ncbi:polyamine ABC transporter substrate-binding protein [Marinomonas ostreistagni]|uniref:Spermidine/putrescine ABC transporter substrate-binding protein n=1 Tax=Marinomonas ostreistagni TaxID=359209 RepID=A0ABS0ZFQ7_9GAMM|nr:spermidine/putrescine ABC transporter substrate-binding protein [Marinomonas ostreistagni]MBJ7552512.1 spermidine/putrescine ABC transporter substrate-binding protein [Marinomonas ostreistagni]